MKRARAVAVLAGAALPLAMASAADAQAPVVPLPGGSGALAQLALSLLLVLALILALAWLARRLRLAPRSAGDSLRVLAELPLGPRERVVLLAVGDRQALVGVSSAGVTPLALLEQPVTLARETVGSAAQPALAERMRALLDRRGSA